MQDRATQTLLTVVRFTSRGSVLLMLAIFALSVLVAETDFGEVPVRVFLGVSALNFTLRAAVPLTLGSLSGILCERSGIINIGIEGMMLAGAFGGFVVKVWADKQNFAQDD